MPNALLVGSTGLVGQNILATLLTHPYLKPITTISRRAPPLPSDPPAEFQQIVSSKTASWPTTLLSLAPAPSIFFSALGTTAKQAGGFAAQKEIDYDLNLALAQAAKEKGVKVYVLISSTGVNTRWGAPFAFLKMKGELESAIEALDFEKTVFLRPGLIVGTREDSRAVEYGLRQVARWMPGKDIWAQDAEVIGRAAVAAGLTALKDEKGEVAKVWTLGQSDIVRLGRTEWE